MLCDPFFLPAILPPSQSPDSTGISIQVGANLIVTPKFKWLSWIDCRGCWSKCEAERSRRVYPRPATWWRRASLRWIRVGPGATSSAPKTWSWPSPSAVSCGARTSAPPRRTASKCTRCVAVGAHLFVWTVCIFLPRFDRRFRKKKTNSLWRECSQLDVDIDQHSRFRVELLGIFCGLVFPTERRHPGAGTVLGRRPFLRAIHGRERAGRGHCLQRGGRAHDTGRLARDAVPQDVRQRDAQSGQSGGAVRRSRADQPCQEIASQIYDRHSRYLALASSCNWRQSYLIPRSSWPGYDCPGGIIRVPVIVGTKFLGIFFLQGRVPIKSDFLEWSDHLIKMNLRRFWD